jgi:hypothetical protein
MLTQASQKDILEIRASETMGRGRIPLLSSPTVVCGASPIYKTASSNICKT